MDDALVLLVALVLFGFGLVSLRAERSVVTPPMVFVLLGLSLGGWGFDRIDLPLENPYLDRLGEFALILVLFSDASRIDLAFLRRAASWPSRLLVVGLPLTFVLGTGVALLIFPELGAWQALVLSAILAPTDAALGLSVVSSPLVPQRVRQALNVESGLNDGIALPVVLLALSLAGMSSEGEDAIGWLRFAALQILLAPVVAIAVGVVGGRALEWAVRRDTINRSYQQLSTLALALVAFAGAESVGGNGFIAAFVCGLTMGNTAPHACESVHEFSEAEGQLLTLIVFFLFGAVVVPAVVRLDEPRHWLYALASLSFVRMVPVAISLVGARVLPATIGFLGWFGPRGLASILYMLIVIEEGSLVANGDIAGVVALTVLISTFAHGVSAHPLARRYGGFVGREEHAERGEFDRAMDMPVRVRFGQR